MAKQHRTIDALSSIILFSIVMMDAILWRSILMNNGTQVPQLSFFDVTQGESALILLPHNIKIMIDSGGDSKIINELDGALSSSNNNYIDLAIISYPQLDNYEGYSYILDHYSIGAFIYNGRNDSVDTKEWSALLDKIHSKNIPLITLGAGDGIQYDGNAITILSPDADLARSADITDTALVEKATIKFTALFASDIGKNVEDLFATQAGSLRSDIVKAPFPISGMLEGEAFIRSVGAKIIMVTPGIKILERSPSKALIASLASSTSARILRTDASGTVTIVPNGNTLHILRGK